MGADKTGPVAQASWVTWYDEDEPEAAWCDDDAKALGAAIRRLRGDGDRSGGKKLTQERLAFRAAMTKNQVQLLEAGRDSGNKDAAGPSNPRMTTLAGVARALGVKVSDLLIEAGL